MACFAKPIALKLKYLLLAVFPCQVPPDKGLSCLITEALSAIFRALSGSRKTVTGFVQSFVHLLAVSMGHKVTVTDSVTATERARLMAPIKSFVADLLWASSIRLPIEGKVIPDTITSMVMAISNSTSVNPRLQRPRWYFFMIVRPCKLNEHPALNVRRLSAVLSFL